MYNLPPPPHKPLPRLLPSFSRHRVIIDVTHQGCIYEGEFQDNAMHGSGTFSDPRHWHSHVIYTMN